MKDHLSQQVASVHSCSSLLNSAYLYLQYLFSEVCFSQSVILLGGLPSARLLAWVLGINKMESLPLEVGMGLETEVRG